MAEQSVHILGIRHHGPGSARSVRKALQEIQPDVVLVEGPPDAADMLPLLIHQQMAPPVALLLYVPDEPRRAVYYPFAVFSPEWQALRYALEQGIPARFMDLPQAHQLALAPTFSVEPAQEGDGPEEPAPEPDAAAPPEHPTDHPNADSPTPTHPHTHTPTQDPLGWLAEAAGYSDGERWWEQMVEHRTDSRDLFAGILEAMTALRQELPETDHPQMRRMEAQREAWMRQTIRQAQKEGFQRIAVVCGAWHAPALAQMPPAKGDAELLKGLSKVKVAATWVPWTYSRLCFESGYGAGIESPGWYHHLWESTERVSVRWLTRVARLFREQDLDASSAHVIEAVRLAEALSALRDHPLPGLPELNEATQSVLCFGGDAPMRLIRDKLIVSERLGEVPDETPMVPLQQDLQREQKRLRLSMSAAHQDLELDLRNEGGRDRSTLLHRLRLLDVPWGEPIGAGRVLGTFKESWRLQWKPEFAVALIEASRWGNTLLDAATAWVKDAAEHAADLPVLTEMADRVMLANLPDAIDFLMARLQAAAALTSDVSHLMDALPALARVVRYGDVRQTDRTVVAHVVDGLVARICIGLPGASASLNDEAAEQMVSRVDLVNDVVRLLENEEYRTSWNGVLQTLGAMEGIHGMLAGRAARILMDAGVFDPEESARRMGLALSTAADPPQAAAWVEGFLKGSGLLLLHDDALWDVLDRWVTALQEETFTVLLPLLRRTFANFPRPERRQMGERVRHGSARPTGRSASSEEFDLERAEAVLPLVARLLGVAS